MGELVTAAAIIAGSGAGGWLADKLLGPSFDALGEQFRAFAGNRLRTIFDKAEKQVEVEKIGALPPGFALMFVQKASFSDESDHVSDLWAGLLADAARGVESRHSVFVDILSQIGPDEAKILDEIFPPDLEFEGTFERPPDLRPSYFDSIASRFNWKGEKSQQEIAALRQEIFDHNYGWPVLIRNVVYRKFDPEKQRYTSSVSQPKFYKDTFSLDVLKRQGLIEYFSVDFAINESAPKVDGYYLTHLGLDLLLACRQKGRSHYNVR